MERIWSAMSAKAVRISSGVSLSSAARREDATLFGGRLSFG
jgi:hypothetical protein